MERLCELREKEVINIKDGARLGFVVDLLVDVKVGKVVKLIVPVSGKLLCFGRTKEYHIPWACVEQIGDDIILVCVNTAEIIVDC